MFHPQQPVNLQHLIMGMEDKQEEEHRRLKERQPPQEGKLLNLKDPQLLTGHHTRKNVVKPRPRTNSQEPENQNAKDKYAKYYKMFN